MSAQQTSQLADYHKLDAKTEATPARELSASTTYAQNERPRPTTMTGSRRDGGNCCANTFGLNPNDLYQIDFDNINSQYQPLYDKYQNDAAMLSHVVILFCPKHAVLTHQKHLLLDNLWIHKVAILICICFAALAIVLGVVHSVFWGFFALFCLSLALVNMVKWHNKLSQAKRVKDGNCVSYYCYDVNDKCLKFVIYDKIDGKMVDFAEHQVFGHIRNFLSINFIEASHGYDSMVEIRCRRATSGKGDSSINIDVTGGGDGMPGVPADKGMLTEAELKRQSSNVAIVSIRVNNTFGINKMEFETIMQDRIDSIRQSGIKLIDEMYHELNK